MRCVFGCMLSVWFCGSRGVSLCWGGEIGLSIGWMDCFCRCLYVVRKREKGVCCGRDVVSVFVGVEMSVIS